MNAGPLNFIIIYMYGTYTIYRCQNQDETACFTL